MEANLDFFANLFIGPLTPKQRFSKDHLRGLFQDKIARSQATGKDGIRVSAFEEAIEEQLAIIERKIADGSFRFTTFKERLILKGAGKAPRQICIPTVRDRLVLRAICQALHTSVPNSVGPSPHKVVDTVAKRLRSSPKPRAFIRIDVKDFFPSIRHDLLESELRKFGIDDLTVSLCMKAVRTKIGDSEKANDRGVPQGLSISGALACIYMLRMDERQSKKLNDYFRYVDDILIIADFDEAERILTSARKAISRIGLTIHPTGTTGKTEISSTEDGIDYLGYNINRKKISIRKSSFRRMFRNLSKVMTDYRYRNDIERFLFRINLKITGCIVDKKRRGWMMFFSRTEDLQQLAHLDKFVKMKAKSLGIDDGNISKIKKFIKSYHEINFNLSATNYVPNFDMYSSDQKVEVVAVLSRRPIEEIQVLNIDVLERQFSRLIGKEIRELEQDVGNPS